VIGADPDELREIDLIPTEGRDFPEVAREKPSRTLSQVNRLIAENPTQEGFEATAEYDTLTNAFVPVMGVSTRTPGTNYGFSAVVGNRFELGRNDVIGVIGALTYSHKYDMFLDGVNNLGGVQPGQPAEQPPGVIRLREDHVGNEELQIGGLATLVYQPNPDHEFALKMILNQAAQDQARFQYQPIGVDGVEQNQTLRYIGRTVTSYQLHGRSDFNVLSWGSPETTGLKLDWFGSINYTRQDEPDVRFFRNKVEDGTYRIPDNSVPALNTRRIFRDIEEYGTQFEANLEIPFVQWSGTMGNIRTGVFAERTEREYRQRSFVYETARQVSGSDLQGFLASSCNSFKFQNVPGEVYTNPRQGGDLWTDVFTDDDRTGYVTEAFCDFFLDIPPGPPFFGPYTEPLPTPAPNQLLWVATTFNDDVIYDGDQEFTAAYAMTDLPLTRKLRLIGGARFEKTLLAIDPSDPLDDPDNPNDGQIKIIEFLDPNQNPCDPTVQDNCTRTIAQVPAEQAAANIDETHVLPSIGLVYEVIPNMNLRTSWSQTIARPTLRELAPAATEEFLFGDSFIGNNRLVISEIENLDLRWEWFRRPGEVLAFSLFKKELTNPIELISFQPTGENSYVQPVNFERGRLEGYEVEFRTGLDLIARRLTGLNIGVNYTDLQSEVDVPLFEQRSLAQFELDQEVRSLQGQPDSVFNINLTYDNARSGTSFGIFYNRVTDTLLTGAAVSEDGKPNVYELTFRPLDVTFSQRVVRFGKSTLSFSAKARNLMQGNLETVYRKPSGAQLTKTERVTAARYSLSAKLSW
jgi:TonB-dependent receptor